MIDIKMQSTWHNTYYILDVYLVHGSSYYSFFINRMSVISTTQNMPFCDAH